MEALVVLGTGTEIGKTYASCRIAERWPACCALKPAETGVAEGAQAEDAAQLSLAANHPYQPPRYAYPNPVSPHLEARRLQQRIDLDEIASWVERTAVNLERARVVVETAGGAFSPLTEALVNADLAETLRQRFEVRVGLVAPNRLGVLHDVLATQRALAAHSSAADFILLTQRTPAEATASSNLQELRALQRAPVFALGYGDASPPTLVEYLARAFAG